MTPAPSSSNKNVILVVVLVLAGSCVLCAGGAIVLGGIGFLTAKDVATPPVPTGVTTAAEFAPPAPFQLVSEGRWQASLADGSAHHGVEVTRFPSRAATSGLSALSEAWSELIVPQWPGAPSRVLPLRRFANNGARVYFASARLPQQGFKRKSLVSLYLLQVDDRFEVFSVVQSSVDESVGNEMTEAGAPDVSHPLVEALFKGLAGSPTDVPLVDDAELVGSWKSSSGGQQQYVYVLTGASGYDAVASSVWWTFEAGHEFTYKFSGAVTDTGNTRFSGQEDRGTWSLEHDLLVTNGDTLKRKFFVVGAGEGPGGKRVVVLMPEGKWTLSPGAIAREGVVLEEE